MSNSRIHKPWELIWKHRTLVWQFSLRQVEIRHKGSYLGFVWAVLNPLLMLGLYVFVFGFIFGGSFGVLEEETKVDYALGIFLGLTVFHLLAETFAIAPAVIVTQPSFVKRVVFPLEILPIAGVAAGFFHFCISFFLIVLGAAIWGHGIDQGIFWVPLIMTPIVLMCLGISWFISAMGVFIRDIVQVVGFASMALLFSSGVFFSPASVPPEAMMILKYNPVLQGIELMRDAVLWSQPISWSILGFLWVVGIVVAIVGYLSFAVLKPAFADVI